MGFGLVAGGQEQNAVIQDAPVAAASASSWRLETGLRPCRGRGAARQIPPDPPLPKGGDWGALCQRGGLGAGPLGATDSCRWPGLRSGVNRMAGILSFWS
jgi:hypothetical protein